MAIHSIFNARTLAFLVLASMNAATLFLLYEPRSLGPRLGYWPEPAKQAALGADVELSAAVAAPQTTSTPEPTTTQPVPLLFSRPSPQPVIETPLLDDDSQRKKAFDGIFRDNFWGNSESRSGYGSMVSYTASVRKLIDHAVRSFGIKSLFDGPSGDCNWQPHLETFPNLQYTGADIVSSLVLANGRKYRNYDNMRFVNLDLVKDKLPYADAFLVRDAVQHLPLADGMQIYRNVENSGAKYLISNFHVDSSGHPTQNTDIQAGQYFGVNVLLPPYNFTRPLFHIADQPAELYESVIKMTAIWELPALGLGDGQAFNVDLSRARDLNFPESGDAVSEGDRE